MVPHYLPRMAHQGSVVRVAAVPARKLPPLQTDILDRIRPAIIRHTVPHNAPDSEPALELLAPTFTEEGKKKNVPL